MVRASCSRGSRDRSARSRPANVTDRDSGRSRLPWHNGHVSLSMKCSARFFIFGLSVFANEVKTCRRALEKVPW